MHTYVHKHVATVTYGTDRHEISTAYLRIYTYTRSYTYICTYMHAHKTYIHAQDATVTCGTDRRKISTANWTIALVSQIGASRVSNTKPDLQSKRDLEKMIKEDILAVASQHLVPSMYQQGTKSAIFHAGMYVLDFLFIYSCICMCKRRLFAAANQHLVPSLYQ